MTKDNDKSIKGRDVVPSDNGERHFLNIDQDELDKALVEQPRLFFKHASKLADARLELDEAESRFDVAKADLSLAIRGNPKKYKLGDEIKITEASIDATITTHPKYVEAQGEVNVAKHAVAILQAVATALDHRKRALEKLVDLHGQDYFSSPRVKGEEANAALDKKRTQDFVNKTKRRRDDDE